MAIPLLMKSGLAILIKHAKQKPEKLSHILPVIHLQSDVSFMIGPVCKEQKKYL